MKPTDFRKKMMHQGDVFAGIKTRDPEVRKKIESERHNKFMDMLGDKPRIEAGFKKMSPNQWVDAFVGNNGREATEALLKTTLRDLTNTNHLDDPQAKPYVTSAIAKKNVEFYKQAQNYFNNKYK